MLLPCRGRETTRPRRARTPGGMADDPPADPADEVIRLLVQAEVLTTRPDVTLASTTHTAPASADPGNTAALDAVTTVWAEARQLEDDLRYEVTGSAGPGRGGSDRNTVAAIEAAGRLAHGTGDGRRKYRRKLASWTGLMGRLLGIDEAVRWLPIRGGPGGVPPACPHCGAYSLRRAEGHWIVACWTPDCEGRDERGRRPVARLEIARLPPHAPVLVWDNGQIQGTAP
jgi:hypothetical protein